MLRGGAQRIFIPEASGKRHCKPRNVDAKCKCRVSGTVSVLEVDRLAIIGRVAERRLTQREAAERLGLSLRQVERL